MPKFMLLQNYEGGDCTVPMSSWAPEEVKAHIDFQRALNRELAADGELVDAQGLSGPEQARIVRSDGVGAPVIGSRLGPSRMSGGSSTPCRRMYARNIFFSWNTSVAIVLMSALGCLGLPGPPLGPPPCPPACIAC